MKQGSGLVEPVVDRTVNVPPEPRFVVDLEPWAEVFFRNLGDSFRAPEPGLKLSSLPAAFWEDVFVANAYADKGDLEQARTLFADLLHEHPDAWQGFFNAACLEARVGDKDQAIEHFQRAVELEPEKAREFAKTDSDFDSIRDDPRFASLISGEPDSGG